MRTLKEILSKTRYNERELELFLSECWMDYLYFAEHVLGYQIADYHREWLNLATRFKRLAIAAFRGSGKTHFFAGYFIWKAIFSHKDDYECMIVSFKEAQAMNVLKEIKNKIKENDLLKQFVPENRESTWKSTEIVLKNGATFLCKPYNENVRSWHPDDMLCDEVGEYEDKTIFWTAVLGAIQMKQGNVIGIGTKKSTIDLLSELEENGEWFYKEYPAEVDGKVLWPQKYHLLDQEIANKTSLTKVRKEMGELAYQQEYLLKPISSANSLFPYELTAKALANEMKFLPFGRQDKRYYFGYDVAMSLKGDYVVMNVLEVDAGKKTLVYAERFRDNFEEQKKKVRAIYSNFHPVKGNIDANGLGSQQAVELQQEFPNLIAKKYQYDEKYKMMIDLRNEFDKLNMIIPNSKEDTKTYAFAQQLLKECNEFTINIDVRPGQTTRPKFKKGEYDDCVDSLALANNASISLGSASLRGFIDENDE